MRCALWSLLATGVLASFAACGDDETREAPPPATPTVEKFVTGVCDLEFRCCQRGEINYVLGPYVDEHDCVGRLLNASTITSTTFELATFSGPTIALPNLAALERAVSDGRVEVDAAQMDACVAYLSDLACAVPKDPTHDVCIPPEPGVGSTPCDAEALFIGKVESGDECSSSLLSLECAQGLACARDSELGVKGECVPAGDVGDKCFTDLECGVHVNGGELAPGQNRRERLYCSQADGTCQKLRREGETCLWAEGTEFDADPSTLLIRCAPGLWCDHVTDVCVTACNRGAPCVDDSACDKKQELTCIAGRCDSLRGEGAPCLADDDCVEPLGCGTNPLDGQHVCAKRLPIGDPCAGHSDCDSGFCEPVTHKCKAQVKPGGLCPTGQNAECDQGACTSELLFCSSDTDCPGSNKCDLAFGQCAYYCVALKPDGAQCDGGFECASEQCVAGFCRTPPLEDGVGCDQDTQCKSAFCSLDPMRVCTTLPLGLGKPCSQNEQCESELCWEDPTTFEPTCTMGLGEGESCGSGAQIPCAPTQFYCDYERDPPACSPLKKTGEDCTSEVQCRGDCLVRFDRKMCFPPADPSEPLCAGAEPKEVSP